MDRAMRKFVVFFGISLIGVLFAAIVNIMNTQQIFIDEWMLHYGYAAITDVMAWIIIVSMLIGVIVAAST